MIENGENDTYLLCCGIKNELERFWTSLDQFRMLVKKMLMILKGGLNWSKNIKLKNIRAGLVLFDWLIDIYIKSFFWSRSWLRHDSNILKSKPTVQTDRNDSELWLGTERSYLIRIEKVLYNMILHYFSSKRSWFLIEIGLK